MTRTREAPVSEAEVEARREPEARPARTRQSRIRRDAPATRSGGGPGRGAASLAAATGGLARLVRLAAGVGVEYFGWVSFERPAEGEPAELRASADFTDVTAADNPDWKIDLSDDVIGAWRAEGDRDGDITLIWGLPLVRGAVAATAELDEEVLDQAPVQDGRFTLVAVDAVHGFGDDLFVEVKLWDRTLREIAAESLYDEGE